VDEVNLIEVTDNMANAEESLFTFPNGTALPVDDYGSTPEKAHQLPNDRFTNNTVLLFRNYGGGIKRPYNW